MSHQKLYAVLTIGLISGLMAGCNSEAPSPQSARRVDQGPQVPTEINFTPASGDVTFGGAFHEDGTPMTDAELADAISRLPNLGTDYDKLHAGAWADITSDGTVTLSDAAGGNVIISVPQAGVGTIRSIEIIDGTPGEQGECADTTVIAHLSDSEEPPVQQDPKDKPQEGDSAAFRVVLTVACDNGKKATP